MRVSVIIPCYCSQSALPRLVTELYQVLSEHESIEIVLVNDASPDDGETWRIICELATTYAGMPGKSLVGVDLALNSGEHNAVLAGLRRATGDAMVVMDDDGQNPPIEVPRLLEHLTRDIDVVYSTFPVKQHGWFRNLGSRFTNWVAGILMNKPKGLYLSSFKVMARRLVDRITSYPGSFPYIDGLVFRNTRRYAVVAVDHLARQDGRSGYSFARLMKLYTNMAFGFSILPLRVLTFSGMAIAAAAMITALVFIGQYFITGIAVEGWTSLSVLVIFFGGVTLLALGILGEYFGRMYLTLTGKQPYVVHQTVGDIAPPAPPGAPSPD
jgi:polyisoprenyl-phosphate glycosyltransferase